MATGDRRNFTLCAVLVAASIFAVQNTAYPQTPTPTERVTAAFRGSGPAEHPGKSVYEKTCASCHNNPEATKSPSFDTLKQMRLQAISYALTQGKMQMQASALSAEERAAVIDYLVGREVTNDDWVAKMMCPAERSKVDLKAAATVATFGFDLKNHRQLTKAQSGLSTADFSNLELAWAIGFPKGTTMRSQPAIVGNTLFLPVADAARIFAFDIAGQPCLKWVYQSEIPLRTSASYGELPAVRSKPGRKVILVGDLGSHIHMVDAETGKGIWKQHIGVHELSLATGTPVLFKDRVYA
ncbi:MAG: c-type cytochrome, partial [Candidatus Obscuribacterales bacterium]|nr:c-type cytochrome [Steroidobacteraceae bacterium]